jgi:Flavin containing amine oxidoreductase
MGTRSYSSLEKMVYKTVIIGGGIAGLRCALELHRNNYPFLLIEAEPSVGGRMQTVRRDGFFIDRGFHVFNPSYPECKRVSALQDIPLRFFKRGAIVKINNSFKKLTIPLFSLESFLTLKERSIFTGKDLVLLIRLAKCALVNSSDATLDTISTKSYLQDLGFSPRTLAHFFTPFFGGVFLDRELETPASHLLFCLRSFITGRVGLPYEGIGAVPEALTRELPPSSLRLSTKVLERENKTLVLDSSEKIFFRSLVVTCPLAKIKGLKEPRLLTSTWNGAYYVYITIPSRYRGIFTPRLIYLNGSPDEVITNVIPLSLTQPTYAPQDQILLVVVALPSRAHPEVSFQERVREELPRWLPNIPITYLDEFYLHEGLPHALYKEPLVEEDTVYCGDALTSPSLEGALQSGRLAARMLLNGNSPT